MTYPYHNKNDQQLRRYDHHNHHEPQYDSRLDRPEYHNHNPINQNEILPFKCVGSPTFIKTLEESLPAVFSRQIASKAIGGLISPKTLSNLDSLGEGPPKIKIGSKVGYEKTSFINWLKQRLK